MRSPAIDVIAISEKVRRSLLDLQVSLQFASPSIWGLTLEPHLAYGAVPWNSL
ncbi:MAG TPA: hypothetical protein VMU41_00955 [Candidatus Binataceae bacterium]|nr:hypothetical protein [Candidatus Binataceae bacterium]